MPRKPRPFRLISKPSTCSYEEAAIAVWHADQILQRAEARLAAKLAAEDEQHDCQPEQSTASGAHD